MPNQNSEKQPLRVIQVGSEQQAFKVLEQALKEQFEDQNVTLNFKGWPVLEIRLEGQGYDSTITAPMANALVELQLAMNRVYAREVRQSGNPNVLTNSEKTSIQFKAKVEEGSSLLKIDLGEFAQTLVEGLIGKMSPEQMIGTVLGVAVLAGGTLVAKQYLKSRAEERKAAKELDSRLAMSQEETRRLEIVTRATTQIPRLAHAQTDFDQVRNEMLKGVADAETLELQGIKIGNQEAKQLASSTRERATDVQLNGTYRIVKIDWSHDGEARLSLYGLGSVAREFSATLDTTTLTKLHSDTLKEAEWARKGVYFSINATELRGEVTTARIVGVAWPEQNIE